ncbi:MAG TPA: hypothetical protein VM008_02990 [Phycisphaerae bacterium]|nr:hypothetical protein [Phycisphaerae bacterium]
MRYSCTLMDGRRYHESLRRLRLFAGEAELTPEKVSKIVQPFIEEWRPVAVPNRKDVRVSMDPEFMLSQPALVDLTARIRAIGMNLNKSGLKGIHYHNAFQRQLAALAENFDCRGWTESAALFDDPERAGEEPVGGALQLSGRVDVIWARKRVPVAVFEIDSTVKPRSFQKLKEAAAAHKLWVYFGKDVWGFKTFLQKNDPEREMLPVIVPNTFVPSFTDEGGEGTTETPGHEEGLN